MSKPSTFSAPLKFLRTLREHWRIWIVPTVLITAGAAAYAALRPDTWRASQALLVRDEAGGRIDRLGRFATPEAMKNAQETILEIARNESLIKAAIETVGPPAGRTATAAWPTAREVEAMQDAIAVSAPKGAEFGKTEVIYLSVKCNDRDRAIKLTTAICDQLESRLQEIRDRKAQSITAELEKAVALAQSDLNDATSRIETIESAVGSDLGELRTLNDLGTGDSNLRANLNQIKNEMRQAQTAHAASEQQLEQLLTSASSPDVLVATPNKLLESQPALRRIKEGLVDAQLRTSVVLGKMSREHPEVQAAMASEEEVRQSLHRELEGAINGLINDIKVSNAQVQSLQTQLTEVNSRLDRLASMRARYGNLVAEVRQRAETLDKTQKELADARGTQTAARAASLITRLDNPVTGGNPLAPGRTVIAMAGLGGGLATGLGLLLLLTTPTAAAGGRRFSDYLRGRRAGDHAGQAPPRQGTRRSEDFLPVMRISQLPSAGGRNVTRRPVVFPPNVFDTPVGRRTSDQIGISAAH